MKRAIFVTLSQKGDGLLRLLQKLGVLHPEHVKGEAELGSLDDVRHRLNVQASIIKELDGVDVDVPEGVDENQGVSFSEVEALFDKMRDLDDRIKSRERALEQLKPWGDFDPESIPSLQVDGVIVGLWSSVAKFDEISAPEGAILREISWESDRTFFITISRDEALKVARADEVVLPDERLSDVEADLGRLAQERNSVLRNIGRAKAGIDGLNEIQERQEREYHYQVTVRRAFDDGNVKAFAGWMPAERTEEIRQSVESFEVPVVMAERDPLPEESPPVLTRNVFVAKVLEPLLRLLGVPNYRGLDPALFFAPFMMLFFGICLGDVGYGISLIIGGLLLKRLLRKVRAARVAGQITVFFGIASIIVGILTGSIFGIAPWGREWIPHDIVPPGGAVRAPLAAETHEDRVDRGPMGRRAPRPRHIVLVGRTRRGTRPHTALLLGLEKHLQEAGDRALGDLQPCEPHWRRHVLLATLWAGHRLRRHSWGGEPAGDADTRFDRIAPHRIHYNDSRPGGRASL
jgi:V/A-type H+-transporting ATPase subunit I